MAQNNIKSLENDLWESADALREGSKLSSQEYCMPVLGLIYLRYAFTNSTARVAALIPRVSQVHIFHSPFV